MGLIQRVLLLGVLLGCAGAVALLTGWAQKPDMALLYSGLAPEEAARIVEKINDEDVPYELANGGTTIKVPVDRVHSLRLTMASQGLASGGEGGYQILDKEKIGVSPFGRQVNYTRAVEGELVKTIKLLDGIMGARVHIVRPEANLFAGKEKRASASVAVRVKPGWRLGPSKVAAIVNLVAGSVEGLSPEKVVVIDSRGKLLAGGQDEEGDGLTGKANTHLEYKTQVEEYLADKAEDMLSTVLGPNRATVRVDAVVDITAKTETTETYDKEGSPSMEEDTSSTPAVAKDNESPGGSGIQSKTKTTSYYPPSRTGVTQTTNLPGTITSLSVAAMVDLTPSPSKEGEGGEAGEAPEIITIKEVEDIIRNALGLKEGAGTLKVVQTTFHKPADSGLLVEEDTGGMFSVGFLLEVAKRLSLGILVIGVLLALRILRGPKKKLEGQTEAQLALEGNTEGAGNLLPAASEGGSEFLRAQISQALQNNPEEVKRLFQNWVGSGKGGA